MPATDLIPPTRVVNIHASDYDVYIGRAGKNQDGYFGNPHPVCIPKKPETECPICKTRHTRPEAVAAYAAYFKDRIERDPEFRTRVEALRGKRLGCFCRPAPGFQGKLLCHGQVIAGFLEGKDPTAID